MPEWLHPLLVASPGTVAVIYVVILFLRHTATERAAFVAALDRIDVRGEVRERRMVDAVEKSAAATSRFDATVTRITGHDMPRRAD